MELNFELLTKVPLFYDINPKEIATLLKCLSAQVKYFTKNEIIFMEDETVTSIGIILNGSVQIVKEDFLGNRAIISKLGAGDLFGETYSCTKIEKLPVSVFATTDSKIMMIDYRRIITTCSSSCAFHNSLVENMLKILAEKNVMLNQKIEILSKRSTREKLIAYLFAQSQKTGNSTFDIPFNRQELADYLCVDRSAMSNELSKLQNENILKFNKNRFQLLEIE